MTKIKEMPIEERPIEKLLKYGVETLSNEELLAIILKTGTKELSSLELAHNLLNKLGGLKKFKEIPLNILMKEKGIGLKKATMLVACFELYKRMENVGLEYQKKILSSSDVVEYFLKKFESENQEYFYCIYLDAARKMIENKLLFKGTLNYSLVHPREVFKYAYINGAVSLIFVHNHPTGEICPSKNDIEITAHLKKIGELHGIKVEDHIIIGCDNYYSFFENKLLENI